MNRKCKIVEIGIRSPFFEQIRVGKKTVEGRCATPKYCNITTGDTLLIKHPENKASFKRYVSKTKRYKTFWQMIQDVGHQSLLPQTKSPEEAHKIYLQFPGYQQEEPQHGAVAIWMATTKP